MKTVTTRMLDAITYDGSRLKGAWLMAVASYTYTRAHDGAVINDLGDTINFGRWYSFCGACGVFWDRIWE